MGRTVLSGSGQSCATLILTVQSKSCCDPGIHNSESCMAAESCIAADPSNAAQAIHDLDRLTVADNTGDTLVTKN
jgi:hypothetical protein